MQIILQRHKEEGVLLIKGLMTSINPHSQLLTKLIDVLKTVPILIKERK